MPTLINELCELADFSEVQAFFNQRGFCLIDDAIYRAEDSTLADEIEIYELARDFEALYE